MTYAPLSIAFITTLQLIPMFQCCFDVKSTEEIVESCPRNQTMWNEAATRKNCSLFNLNCTSSNHEYHCLANHFLNATYEVCAEPALIFNGWCAEYNEGGKIVQGNYNTNCKIFNKTACPSRYYSDEAYKYHECYDLVVRASPQPLPRTPSTTSGYNTTPIVFHPTEGQENKRPVLYWTLIGLGIIIPAINFSFLLLCLFYWDRKKSSKENTTVVSDEEEHCL